MGAILVGTYLDDFVAEIKQETLADVTFYDGQGQVLATTFRGGGEQVDILEVSPAFCQSIVLRPDEILHRSFTLSERPYEMAFGPLQIRESLLGVFSVALSSTFIVQKAGTSRLQFGLLFTSAMALVFVFGYLISRRTIAREVAERDRRSKAETLAAMGDMTGIMAHRMNNILGAARANLLNIARKRARGELAPEFVEESLQEVMGSIDKALGMLKTLSRPFRSDKELEEVDVNSSLSSALKRPIIPEGIQVIEDYTEGLPTVLATREYLIEVFGNLIANAIEAMGDTGRLGLHSQLADNWIEVSVIDTGPGIPEELQEKIFELGYSFKKTGEGLGFGLWWSRTFLERLGGSLHVESQVGAGSKFVVRLPAGAKRESE